MKISPNILGIVSHFALLGGQPAGLLCPSFFLMCHFPPRSVPLSTNGHDAASLIRVDFTPSNERVHA